MFPIRDTIPTRRFPIVNLLLIVMNVGVFLLQLWVRNQYGDQGLTQFTYGYGLVPAYFEGGGGHTLHF